MDKGTLEGYPRCNRIGVTTNIVVGRIITLNDC